jgi:hypothetical protein
MRKLIAILLLCAAPACAAAINATMQWDVQTTGNDANGGGFDPGVGSPGTDFSQGGATAFTDLVCATTTCTSVTLGFSSAAPGNTLNIASGPGCNTGVFEILSQSTGTATLNASAGTGTCTGRAYGTLATLCSAYSSSNCTVGAIAHTVAGNTIWVKSGTYTTTVGFTLTNAAATSVAPLIEGYASTHGDFGTRPLLTTATNSLNVFSIEGEGTRLINLSVSITASTPFSCFGDSNSSSATLLLYKVKCDMSAATAGAGLYQQNSGVGHVWGLILDSEFSCNSTGYGIEDLGGNNNAMVVKWSYFHGCAAGIWDGNNGSTQEWFISSSVFASNGRGIYQQSSDTDDSEFVGNSFYNQTNEGIYLNASGVPFVTAANNIFWGGTYGIRLGGGPVVAFAQTNAYGNQGTAAYLNWVAGIASSDITLTASPFNNPSGGDFSLNSTPGGGALLKAAGFPGVSPFGTGYLDVGALQSQAASGSAPHAYVQ